MEILEKIDKTRQYLNYIEEHVLNVQKAWKVLQEKCKDMKFIYDGYVFDVLNTEINNHDASKLSMEEFTEYREFFFPTEMETMEKRTMDAAWDHHKICNPHHWENWTENKSGEIYFQIISIAHMVVDWMAMGYKFGGTAKSYYEKNQFKLNLPKDAVEYMYEIFERTE